MGAIPPVNTEADLQYLKEKIDRIEQLLERICPPAEVVSVQSEVKRIRGMVKTRRVKK